MTDVVNIDNTQVILDVQSNNLVVEVLPANSRTNVVVENNNGIDIYQAAGTIEISAGESIQGPKGDKGDAAATVTVGSTTTGNAGTSASVTNSGSSSAVVLNFTIPKGDTGSQGTQGIQGLKGDTGLTGATGPAGSQGIQGIKGDTGLQGVKGDTGNTGLQGIQGVKGDTGSQGIQGIQGIQGEQGIQGLKGDTGNTGNAGSDGDRYSTTSITSFTLGNSGNQTITLADLGVDYSTGQSIIVANTVSNIQYGTVVSYTAATGALIFTKDSFNGSGTYASWSVNLSGAVGIQGPQGIKGDTGNQGAQGIQGIQGVQGEQGLQGIQGIKGDTGDTGATGPQGIQGLKGDTGNTGATGATGAQGIQGVKGDTGATGATGPAGVIATNTAVTGLIETASIVNSATTGTINIDTKTSTIYYYTTGSTSSFILNIRGDASTTLNSTMSTGQSITVVFLNTTGASTSSYPTSFSIDSTTVTPKWVVGVTPAAGNASSIDAYTYTIFKTGSSAYSVLASQTRYA